MKGQIKPRWKPGESGNPAGRPKEPPALKATLATVLADKVNGQSTLETILRAMVARAVKGDVRAAQELLDRAFGKSKQSVDISAESKSFNLTFHVMSQETADEINRIKED